ncbi:MAG: aspartate aminotransferase family protein [Bacteriovoracaceae bacterium]|jgi:glutamate/tyrosine decarboxylase-like PLP-dependent enzyme|nr:aspartate aminotransferase family protein [Bacteriovoracaceae bacterium]
MTQKIQIPETGLEVQDIFNQMDNFKQNDYDWNKGKVFCLTYPVDETHHDFLKEAYGKFISENFLNPMAFESLKKMEREVVRMSLDLLNGDDQSVGTMTSGGTESILMAVKAARDYARKHRPWIRRPELVAPLSAHVAFEKACKYFGLKYVPVKLDDDFKVNMKALKKAVGLNTVMIVGSAPQYPQGTIDHIEQIGAFAKKKNILFHVDACVGGFILPWLEALGEDIPPFDFRVDGVTSMSADLHKYGFAAKGASVVLYKNIDYMKHQFFITTDWTGGVYASPNLPGTRPGGAIAAAWATLKKMGKNGYMEQAKRTITVANEFKRRINEIDGLQICGDPKATLFSFRSTNKDLDIYAVADQMTEKKWFFDRQQYPASVHMTVMPIHDAYIDGFIEDLKESVAHVYAHPELKDSGNAAMYGMMAKLPVRGLVKKSVEKVMESMWGASGELPDFEKGIGDENSPKWMQLADKYGPQIMKGLDKVTELKDKLKR